MKKPRGFNYNFLVINTHVFWHEPYEVDGLYLLELQAKLLLELVILSAYRTSCRLFEIPRINTE